MNNNVDKEFLDILATEDSGLKGFVILKDAKTGKTIFKKHNMIVSYGKKYFFEKFIGNNLISLPGGTQTYNYTGNSDFNFELANNDYRLVKAMFGTSGKEVEFTDTTILPLKSVDDTNTTNLLSFRLKNVSASVAEASSSDDTMNVTIDQDNSGHYYLKYEFSFAGENVIGSNVIETVQELGLFLSVNGGSDYDGSNKPDRLFSRIRFDKIPITADSEFLLTYYIYF